MASSSNLDGPMPRISDFPRASLSKAVELARAVDSLGGQCDPEMAAGKLGRKIGGAFKDLIAAASKYGFVESRKQRLYTTNRFRDLKLAYDEKSEVDIFQEAFLGVPLFLKIADRFEGKKLPRDIFEKLLVKEFEVPEVMAGRVATYFIEGAKTTGLLGPDDIVLRVASQVGDRVADDSTSEREEGENGEQQNNAQFSSQPPSTDHGQYTVSIRGPGIQTDIAIHEVDDLDIVEVMLRKVRRKLEES